MPGNNLASQVLMAEQEVRGIKGNNRKLNCPEVARLGRDTQLVSVQHSHGGGNSFFIHRVH